MVNPYAAAFRRILVPLDGSPFAAVAVRAASALAQRSGGEVRLLHVVEVPPVFAQMIPSFDAQVTAREYLGQEAARIGHGSSASTTVREGHVDTEITREVEAWGSDLIVMTSHGRGGASRLWLGSVADRCIRSSQVPVLLVRAEPEAGDPRPFAMERVVVPLDGSDIAEEALPHAAELARLFEVSLELMHVVLPADLRALFDPPETCLELPRTALRRRSASAYLEEKAAALHAQQTPATTTIVVDLMPASAILSQAGRDPIVLTTLGHGGWKRTLLGSVADKVVRGAEGPVLVVPPRSR